MFWLPHSNRNEVQQRANKIPETAAETCVNKAFFLGFSALSHIYFSNVRGQRGKFYLICRKNNMLLCFITRLLGKQVAWEYAKPVGKQSGVRSGARLPRGLFARRGRKYGAVNKCMGLSLSLEQSNFLSSWSCQVETVSANERRLYSCNVFSHWLRPFPRDPSQMTGNRYMTV